MRKINMLLCLALAIPLSACGSPGSYDSNGNYVAPADGRRYHDASESDYTLPGAVPNAVTVTPTYAQRGYYDYYGNYVTLDNNIGVPQNMMPPPGMCRVWLPDRDISRQPGMENCVGIKTRVPPGGYVIYGG